MEKKLPICENTVIHKEIVEEIKTRNLIRPWRFFQIIGRQHKDKNIKCTFSIRNVRMRYSFTV